MIEELRKMILEEERNNDWNVESDGTMSHKKYAYVIPAGRLGENWLEHMSEKCWVNMNTFVTAYIRACHLAGIKSVQVAY